ncbi:MAG: hypothetical protein E7097_06605 [Bacteroides sp.]|nr:hypothetical protein [Bacteroides sp.]
MTQILVTLEDNSLAPKIMKAIEMLKGVVNISIYEKKEETTSTYSNTHSPRIQRLRGIAKGITQQQIEEDERLAYLLNK